MEDQRQKIFFSYSRDNSKFVLKLAEDMRAEGLDLWIDELDIPSGAPWDETVEGALRACPGFLVVLSPSSVASGNVMDEVAFAIRHKKKILPILHQNCEIPFRIGRLQFIDFTGDYGEAFAKLLRAANAPTRTDATGPVAVRRRLPQDTEAPAGKPFVRLRAVLIGADEYKHVQPLKYCGKDVRDIARIFRESLEFDKADVLEFTAEAPLKPERSQIVHHLGEFLKRDIKPDELLLFYFSGHGMSDPDQGEDYLLPIDATTNDLRETGLSVTYITKKLGSTGCKNIVMFIDACRQTVEGAKGVGSIGEASKAALERDGIVTFFSCDPRERSYEIRELENGSFTHCLMNAIQQGSCSTVVAIDQYLRENVPLVNSKYNKPLQRPFTIIKPAEKAQLAIFYTAKRRADVEDRYISLEYRLVSILAPSDEYDPICLTQAMELLARVRAQNEPSAGDKNRLRFIEDVCAGKLPPRVFRMLWDALQRSRLENPAKILSQGL